MHNCSCIWQTEFIKNFSPCKTIWACFQLVHFHINLARCELLLHNYLHNRNHTYFHKLFHFFNNLLNRFTAMTIFAGRCNDIFFKTWFLSNNRPASRHHASFNERSDKPSDYFLIDCFSVILYVCYSALSMSRLNFESEVHSAYWDAIFFMSLYVSHSRNLSLGRPLCNQSNRYPIKL